MKKPLLTPEVKTAVAALRPLTRDERKLALGINTSIDTIVTRMLPQSGAMKLGPLVQGTSATGGTGGGGCRLVHVREVLLDLGYEIFKGKKPIRGPAPDMIRKPR